MGTSSLDIKYRLDELRKLQDGWLNGDGIALSTEGLDRLIGSFEQYYPEELSLPYLYPTTEGGVRAEWTIGDYEVTLEIDLNTFQGNWHALNMKIDAEVPKNLNIDSAEDWSWIIKQIQEMTKAGAV